MFARLLLAALTLAIAARPRPIPLPLPLPTPGGGDDGGTPPTLPPTPPGTPGGPAEPPRIPRGEFPDGLPDFPLPDFPLPDFPLPDFPRPPKKPFPKPDLPPSGPPGHQGPWPPVDVRPHRLPRPLPHPDDPITKPRLEDLLRPRINPFEGAKIDDLVLRTPRRPKSGDGPDAA